MTSHLRPEVEIWPFRACAVKNMQYNPYLMAELQEFLGLHISLPTFVVGQHCGMAPEEQQIGLLPETNLHAYHKHWSTAISCYRNGTAWTLNVTRARTYSVTNITDDIASSADGEVDCIVTLSERHIANHHLLPNIFFRHTLSAFYGQDP